MKKRKALRLTLASLATTALPVFAITSCSTNVKDSYDFGLATTPLTSLNYIKFSNTAIVMPTLVEGLMKKASNNKVIQTQLSYPKYDFHVIDGEGKNAQFSSNFWDLKNMGYLPGTTISSAIGNPVIGHRVANSVRYDSFAFALNSEHKWSNGDFVTGEDYADAAKYILDLNTGSQLITRFLELNIAGSSEMIEVQKEYYKKFAEPYKDPWGYNDGWTSQNPGDKEVVDKIKKIAQSFGMFTKSDYDTLNTKVTAAADKIENYHNDISWYAHAGAPKVNSKHQLFIQFKDSSPMVISAAFNAFTSLLLPINRKFVEAHGGIQKYGIDLKHFLWNGPFNISDMSLGPSGFINLVKNKEYYSVGQTVSNKIKILFQANPTILASLFEDGYISYTKIPAIFQKIFWANNDIRRYMKKTTGFGTMALELNVDSQSGANPAMQDENFRKAIAYSLDRQAVAMVAGLESSFPVTTWTAFGQAKDEMSRPLEGYFDGESYIPYIGAKPLPIQSFPFSVHNTKTNSFEKIDRTDIGFNAKTAKHFLDLYKKAHPNQKHVNLTYIYDGTTVNKNLGIYFKSQLDDISNGFINVEIKGLPGNVFSSFQDTGKFDILFRNFDSYGTELNSYVKRFFVADGIDKEQQKTIGFKDNPAGSWVYSKFFEQFKNDNTKKLEVQHRLGISDDVWSKIVELSTKTEKDTIDYKDRLDAFFHGRDVDVAWQSDQKVISIVIGLEKILREAMPIIPLIEVDTDWTVSRIGGVSSMYTFNLQTAYDVDNKPSPVLPGVDSL